jgi:hypothetical protein
VGGEGGTLSFSVAFMSKLKKRVAISLKLTQKSFSSSSLNSAIRPGLASQLRQPETLLPTASTMAHNAI